MGVNLEIIKNVRERIEFEAELKDPIKKYFVELYDYCDYDSWEQEKEYNDNVKKGLIEPIEGIFFEHRLKPKYLDFCRKNPELDFNSMRYSLIERDFVSLK